MEKPTTPAPQPPSHTSTRHPSHLGNATRPRKRNHPEKPRAPPRKPKPPPRDRARLRRALSVASLPHASRHVDRLVSGRGRRPLARPPLVVAALLLTPEPLRVSSRSLRSLTEPPALRFGVSTQRVVPSRCSVRCGTPEPRLRRVSSRRSLRSLLTRGPLRVPLSLRSLRSLRSRPGFVPQPSRRRWRSSSRSHLRCLASLRLGTVGGSLTVRCSGSGRIVPCGGAGTVRALSGRSGTVRHVGRDESASRGPTVGLVRGTSPQTCGTGWRHGNETRRDGNDTGTRGRPGTREHLQNPDTASRAAPRERYATTRPPKRARRVEGESASERPSTRASQRRERQRTKRRERRPQRSEGRQASHRQRGAPATSGSTLQVRPEPAGRDRRTARRRTRATRHEVAAERESSRRSRDLQVG